MLNSPDSSINQIGGTKAAGSRNSTGFGAKRVCFQTDLLISLTTYVASENSVHPSVPPGSLSVKWAQIKPTSWASLVAQMVKTLPVIQETGFDPWVKKIPKEKGMAPHFSILAWRIPRTEKSLEKSRTRLSNFPLLALQ